MEVTITGTDKVSGSFKSVRKASDETAQSFSRLEDASDKTENRAQGLASTLTGTQDVMVGFGQVAKGDVFGGLVTLGGGFADLAEGVNYTVVPALRAMTKQSLLQARQTVAAAANSARAAVVEKARAAVTWTVTGAQKALNAVMRANPIGIVITAIIALIAIFTALYKNNKGFRDFVDKMWRSIRKWVGDAVKTVGEWLGRFGRWLADLRDRSANFREALARVFRAVADNIGDRLRNARENFNRLVTAFRNVRDRIADIKNRIVAVFQGLVDGVAERFARLQVRLSNLVETIKVRVINPLIRLLNRIPGVSIRTLATRSETGGHPTQRRQVGGRIGGHGSGDVVPVMAEPGEHMFTKEEVRRAGGHQVIERLRRSLRQGRGLFEPPTGGDPRRFVQRLAQGGVIAARAMAKRLHGRPYVWGGLDCSGYMSAILNAWEGKNSLARRFTTATIAAGNGLVAGLAKKRGNFNIGSYRGNPGHMAGTLDGINVESGGGHGVMYNQYASGAEHSRFTSKFHASGGFDWTKWIKEKIGGLLDRLTGVLSGDSFALRIARAVVKLARDHVLGSFASGTRYVPRTGPYMLHRGEQVTAAGGCTHRIVFDLRGGGTPLERALLQTLRKAMAGSGLSGVVG